jgi:hypothetical protein
VDSLSKPLVVLPNRNQTRGLASLHRVAMVVHPEVGRIADVGGDVGGYGVGQLVVGEYNVSWGW